jgi:membrane protein DedA with SNARE-associated domain
MDAARLIRTYGYWALIVGTFFEGETVLAFGGYAAHEGTLDLPWVLLCGGMGVFGSDLFCFFLGRHAGLWCLRRFPAMGTRVRGVLDRVERHQNWLIVGFQFVPGTSTVTPIALGMSRVRFWRFLVLDLVGIALWTVVFALAGYLCGAAVGYFLADLHRYDGWLLAAFAASVLFFGARRMLRGVRGADGRHEKRQGTEKT